MQGSDNTPNDGQVDYLCILCDVFWPQSSFYASDILCDNDRRICAMHRDELKPAEHGHYRYRGGGHLYGCYEPNCAICAASKSKK